MEDLSEWYSELECPNSYDQIQHDLDPFKVIDMDMVAKEAVSRFSDYGRHSLIHYKIIDNQVSVIPFVSERQFYMHVPRSW